MQTAASGLKQTKTPELRPGPPFGSQPHSESPPTQRSLLASPGPTKGLGEVTALMWSPWEKPLIVYIYVRVYIRPRAPELPVFQPPSLGRGQPLSAGGGAEPGRAGGDNSQILYPRRYSIPPEVCPPCSRIVTAAMVTSTNAKINTKQPEGKAKPSSLSPPPPAGIPPGRGRAGCSAHSRRGGWSSPPGGAPACRPPSARSGRCRRCYRRRRCRRPPSGVCCPAISSRKCPGSRRRSGWRWHWP